MAAQVEVPNGIRRGFDFPLPTNARALTAAAMKLDPTDLRTAAMVKKWRQDWQRYAWDFYQHLPIIHYGHDYYGNVCSRVRLYAGFQSDPDDPPIPLDDLAALEDKPHGSDDATSAAAVEGMHRLDRSADGGLSGLMGDLAVNQSLVGECFLYGKVDPKSPTGETFAVYSTEEMRASDLGYQIHRQGQAVGQPIGDDDYVLRIWRRNRQYRDLADAPMMALLEDCDNLLLLTRVLKAISSSRIHGGIFLTPSEWHFPTRASTDPNAQGQAADIPLIEQMKTAFTTPIQDPSSVASVVPMHLEGPAATLGEARFIDFGRGYGQDILKEIDDVKQGIALGLDLPIEVVMGHASTTFSNAWQIAEETFKAHIEPLVMHICRALTDGYLWPLLEAQGLDPTGYSVWYDPGQLIGHVDLFTNMKLMHDAFAVSDDALRRAGGANDDDAPDDDEVQRRLYILQAQKFTIRETGIAPSSAILPPSDLTLTPEQSGQPSAAKAITAPKAGSAAPPPSATGPTPMPALTAAGTKSPLAQLGPRLADIDRRLTAQVQTLADAALQRTLERAGAAVARKVRGSTPSRQRGSGLAAEIAALDVEQIPQHLGREAVLAMGLSEDKLIDGQLGQLEPQFKKLTKRALAAALLAGQRAVPDGGLTDDHTAALSGQQDTWIAAGFAILSAAILATAHDQLFTPAQQPAGPGEMDLSTRVDPSAIREALAVAGGEPAAQAIATDASTPPGGVATGTLVLDAFKQALQILPSGWQWVYGYPDREFPPHEALEGQEFSSWTDPILANDSPDGWPDVAFYRPGDHRGCSCSYIASFISDRPNDTSSDELASDDASE